MRFHSIAIAVVLMLLLPLQAMSSVLAPIFCSNAHDHAAEQRASAIPHEHGGTHANAGSHSHQSTGDSGTTAASHGVCHHVSAAALTMLLDLTVPADLPVYSSSLQSLVSLFIPEQPQRPPRA